MNHSVELKRNPRVASHCVDHAIWGLYNLDTGALLFMDEFSFRLLELAESFASVEELAAACRDFLGSRASSATLRIESRLEELLKFGAILENLPEPPPKVLLVDPPCSPGLIGHRGPAKGLCYLSQSLVEHGLPPARILDMRSVSDRIGESARVEYFARYAGGVEPDIVGITAVSATIENALLLARTAKLMFPEVWIVMGGPHVSYEWRSILREHACVDVIVIGEGEIPFPFLVERLAAGGRPEDLADITGFAWRDAEGEPVTSGWCSGLTDLDQISFPDDRRDLINLQDYEIEYPRILTGRGCPFHCSFCSTATFTNRRLRQRSITSVIAEIAFYWRQYGATKFTFDDDIFTVRKQRTLDFCEAFRQAEFAGQVEWGCNTRIDCIDEELIDAMYQAGCRWILLGIESGDADVQNRFGKGKRSLVRFRDKLGYLVSRGIEPQLNFILGLPGEDRRSVEKILALVEGQPFVPCGFNFLTVFPGTPMADQLDELGIEILGQTNRDRYSLTVPTVATPAMSARDQIEMFLELQWARKRELSLSLESKEVLTGATA